MAGIIEALQNIENKKDSGVVAAVGFFHLDLPTRYVIIKLDATGELITQYDYGSDLILQDSLKFGDRVKLIAMDGYTAIWIKEEEYNLRLEQAAQVPQQPQNPFPEEEFVEEKPKPESNRGSGIISRVEQL